MAQTALSPKIIQAIGSFTPLAVGVAGGSGTSTVVTVSQFTRVLGAGAMGATSTTAVYVDTISTNTFTVTHASADLFFWIAYGDAKV